MFAYSHANTPLGQSDLSYFIKENITDNRRKQEKTWENITKIRGKQVKDSKTGETRENRQKQRKTGKRQKRRLGNARHTKRTESKKSSGSAYYINPSHHDHKSEESIKQYSGEN